MKRILLLATFALLARAAATSSTSAIDPPSSTRKKDRPNAAKIRQLEEAVLSSRPLSDNAFTAQLDGGGVDEGVAVVHVSKNRAKKLSLKTGDLVSVRGKKRKYSMAAVHVGGGVGESVVQLSTTVARNIRVRNGDHVVINPINNDEVVEAEQVTVQPFSEDVTSAGDLSADDLTANFVKQHFGKNKFAQVEDTFSVQHEGRTIQFKVTGVSNDKAKMKSKSGGKKDDAEAPTTACLVGEETGLVCDLEDLPSRAEDPSLNAVGYDDLGGCRSQMAAIRELVELPLRHPTLFSKVGVPPPRGVLLHGPSGTGKTSLCRAVAAETGAFFFVVNGPEVMSKGSGESEKNLRLAFEEAEKNSPAIIFIDEIDCIAPKRDKAGGEMEKRTVSQLMTLMVRVAMQP